MIFLKPPEKFFKYPDTIIFQLMQIFLMKNKIYKILVFIEKICITWRMIVSGYLRNFSGGLRKIILENDRPLMVKKFRKRLRKIVEQIFQKFFFRFKNYFKRKSNFYNVSVIQKSVKKYFIRTSVLRKHYKNCFFVWNIFWNGKKILKNPFKKISILRTIFLNRLRNFLTIKGRSFSYYWNFLNI